MACRIFCRFGVVAKNCTLTTICLKRPSSRGLWFWLVVMRPPLPSIAARTSSCSSAPARLGAVFLRKNRRASRSFIASSAFAVLGRLRGDAPVASPAAATATRSRRRSAGAAARPAAARTASTARPRASSSASASARWRGADRRASAAVMIPLRRGAPCRRSPAASAARRRRGRRGGRRRAAGGGRGAASPAPRSASPAAPVAPAARRRWRDRRGRRRCGRRARLRRGQRRRARRRRRGGGCGRGRRGPAGRRHGRGCRRLRQRRRARGVAGRRRRRSRGRGGRRRRARGHRGGRCPGRRRRAFRWGERHQFDHRGRRQRLQLRAEVEDLARARLDLGRRRARRCLLEELRLLEQRDEAAALPLSPRSTISRTRLLAARRRLELELREPGVVGQQPRHVLEQLHRAAETRTSGRARSCSRRSSARARRAARRRRRPARAPARSPASCAIAYVALLPDRQRDRRRHGDQRRAPQRQPELPAPPGRGVGARLRRAAG